MKVKLICPVIVVLLVLTFLLTTCTQTTSTTSTTTSKQVNANTSLTTNTQTELTLTQVHWWDKLGTPQYGGDATTLALAFYPIAPQFDPDAMLGTDAWCYEQLFYPDWTLDRNEWSMSGVYTPEKFMSGNLAEKWEINDPQTITVYLRHGVHWQDKAPVNGREFTSDDVVFHYDRLLGTGHDYLSPTMTATMMMPSLKNVTAIDKYTVQFHFKIASAGTAFLTIANPDATNWFEAPEWVALGGPPTTETPPAGGGGFPPFGDEPPADGAQPSTGDSGGFPSGGFPPMGASASGPLADWKQVVGTGPWILSDFVSGSSETWSKNPNYWGHDPRYQQNQTPYLNSVTVVVIKDTATQVAALRTGKLDILSGIDWMHTETLNDLNLQKAPIPLGGGTEGGIGVTWRNDLKPFNDIRVRKALDMSIDRKAIAQSLYHGLTDGNPVGLITPGYKGYCYAYEDWPQSLKDEYAYNPAKAKELLTEAGYPDGFKTDCLNVTPYTDEMLQVFKDYFKDIGVDIEITVMDQFTGGNLVRAGKHTGMVTANTAFNWPPNRIVGEYFSGGMDASISGLKYQPDPVLEDLYTKFQTTGTTDEIASITAAYDKQVIEQHYGVFVGTTSGFTYWQSYLKGYSMELLGGGQQIMWSRLWFDTALKKTMGRQFSNRPNKRILEFFI